MHYSSTPSKESERAADAVGFLLVLLMATSLMTDRSIVNVYETERRGGGGSHGGSKQIHVLHELYHETRFYLLKHVVEK